MKKILATIGIPILLLTAAIIGWTGNRPVADHASPATVYSFDYYPRANVYYNHADGVYSFADNQGNWVTSRELPASYRQGLDKKITLNGPSKNIWKHNEQHRMIYSIQLYASPRDFEADPLPPPPPVPAKKADPVKTEPREKGLKKFFNKLFGKEKKEV